MGTMVGITIYWSCEKEGYLPLLFTRYDSDHIC